MGFTDEQKLDRLRRLLCDKMRKCSYATVITTEYCNSTAHQQNNFCQWVEFSRTVQAIGERVFGKSYRKNYVRHG